MCKSQCLQKSSTESCGSGEVIPSDLRRHPGADTFIARIHTPDRLLVPSEVDLRLSVIPDAVDKFVDQADPLVEVSVLHGITVVRGSVVIDIRPEAVA